jgi:exodeoxyribonuclease VII large subunit
MDPGTLRRRLYEWRAERATREGITELFRILPSATLDAIAHAGPKTLEELVCVKGIKDAKARAYGDEILAIVGGALSFSQPTPVQTSHQEGDPMTYSVSVYLDILHRAVSQYAVRVVGETLEVKTQGSYTYFSLLDPTNRSVLRVMISRTVLDFAGIELSDGIEIAVTGRADIYKPRGTLTFRADTVELVGEGALKKHYDMLKQRLSQEGLFDEGHKRQLPEYPVRIGLLTSKTGAVIHDFQSNLGHHGFQIRFKDIRVEGAQAVPDILSGLERMKKEKLDVLVLIRGGGSMESLQAFNHEEVVRVIAQYPVPVICAIGHDKDVPLAQLASDVAPSTPTASAELLNRSWREGAHLVHFFTKDILSLCHEQLWIKKDQVRGLEEALIIALSGISSLFAEVTREVEGAFLRIQKSLAVSRATILRDAERLYGKYQESLRVVQRELIEQNTILLANNPIRQLRLGYSILSRNKIIIRSQRELPEGTDFEVTLADGTLGAVSKGKKPNTA